MSTCGRIAGRPMVRWMLAVWLASCGSQSTQGEDRVTVRPVNATGRIAYAGTILQYNDEGLTLRVQATGESQKIPPERIELVEVYRNEEHLRAVTALAEGRTDDAITAATRALESEKRTWLRHEILGVLIQAHRRRNELEAAVGRFVEIVLEEPRCREWSVAPLAWEPLSISDSLRQRARRWMVTNNDTVRLVAASILVADPESAPTAQLEIDRQARNGDPYLRCIAQAHQWKGLIQRGTPSDIELARWKGDIERMPESLRAGPWYVLGLGYQRRQEYESAAAAWLWLPTVHSENEPLAARATFEAARALERRNQPAAARQLYEEIVTRYSWSTFVSESRDAMKPTNP